MTTKLPKLPGLPEAVAYCESNNPHNDDAFAWPGTDRKDYHTTQLYDADQMQAYAREAVADALRPAGDNAEHVRVLEDFLNDQHWSPELSKANDALAALPAAIAALSQPKADVAWVGKIDAGLRLASMLRDDVRLDDFQSAVADIAAEAYAYAHAQPAPKAEAVTDIMVQAGLDAAIDASDARLARYSVVRAIIAAALTQGTLSELRVQQPSVTVTEGFVLVPVKLTDAIREAGRIDEADWMCIIAAALSQGGNP